MTSAPSGLLWQRIPLSDMTREEINQLMQDLGFYRKEKADSPVPEEYRLAPSRPPPGSEAAKKEHGTEDKGAAGGEL